MLGTHLARRTGRKAASVRCKRDFQLSLGVWECLCGKPHHADKEELTHCSPRKNREDSTSGSTRQTRPRLTKCFSHPHSHPHSRFHSHFHFHSLSHAHVTTTYTHSLRTRLTLRLSLSLSLLAAVSNYMYTLTLPQCTRDLSTSH